MTVDFSRRPVRWMAPLLSLLSIAPVTLAASRAELTWIPSGQIAMSSGTYSIWFNLPKDPDGVLPLPMVLVAFYTRDPNVTVDPTSQPAEGVAASEALLKLKVGDVAMPDWLVKSTGSAYVVNLRTIASSPRRHLDQLAIEFDNRMLPGFVSLYALGAPDPLLVGDSLDGPLDRFMEQAGSDDIRVHYKGLAAQFANAPEEAGKHFRNAARSKDERVASYARRNLRLLRLFSRSSKDKDNFAVRYKWGLYLQQCGFFQAALAEFHHCTELSPKNGSSWYRLSEVADRCGHPPDQIAALCARAGQSPDLANPTVWNMLVVFLRKREIEVMEDGKPIKKTLELTPEEIATLKEEWLLAENYVLGASRGTMLLSSAFFTLEDESRFRYVRHCERAVGPPDDLIDVRGWFDGVLSFRPRLPGEPDVTVGGDCGVNGAALSDLGAHADAAHMLEHWYHQLDWTLRASEVAMAVPSLADARSCGVGPGPSLAYGVRSAMRYELTPADYRRAKVTPTTRPLIRKSQPGSTQPAEDHLPPYPVYARYWRVEGPFPVGPTGDRDDDQEALKMPAAMNGVASRVIDSETDFVDLAAALSGEGRRVAKATCWIKSPFERQLQLWLGAHHRAAVWVNGRQVVTGRYRPQGKYAESRQVDMIGTFAILEEGWNRIEVVVEALPAPRGRSWGFSVRLTEFNGQPPCDVRFTVDRPAHGVAADYVAPESGYYYSWARCESGYRELLPRLDAEDLAALTGLRSLAIRVRGDMIAIAAPGRQPSRNYREAPDAWDATRDRDVTLNNVMDWSREDVLAIRFEREGAPHDLLLLKPEAVEAYTTLLKEPPEAADMFGALAPANRIMGFVLVPTDSGTFRTLIAVDVLLAARAEDWPVDEEDLLEPAQQ